MNKETIKATVKGEMLSRIFKRMDDLKLDEKMRNLFLDNGLNFPDLTALKHRNKEAFKQ